MPHGFRDHFAKVKQKVLSGSLLHNPLIEKALRNYRKAFSAFGVPRAGLEPAHPKTMVFETIASTIPPSGHFQPAGGRQVYRFRHPGDLEAAKVLLLLRFNNLHW